MSARRSDGLTLHAAPFRDACLARSRRRLLHDVLGDADVPPADPSGSWRSIGLFDSVGVCVGNVDVGRLGLTLRGVTADCAGIRAVAVAPPWRGRGLFRDLMQAALALARRPVFLYAETPALYEKFGFKLLAQHAFVGPSPEPRPGQRATVLPLANDDLQATITRLWPRRAPVSSHCALRIDRRAFLANLGKDTGLHFARIAEPETVVVFEMHDQELVVVDIVARKIPDLATLLGALGVAPRRVTVLFPPDRLGWTGVPRAEDTGLMVLGPVPDALTRPFMFPPTVEF